MKIDSTGPTNEYRTRAPIVAGDVPTATTRLRGKPGIGQGHRTAALLCLVHHKTLELGERPAMNAALCLRLVPAFDSAPDASQILQHDGATRSSRFDNLLRQDVVGVSAEPGLLVTHLPQMPLRALGATTLEGTTQFEVPSLGRFPRLLAEKEIGAGDGRLCQSEINADDGIDRRDHRGGHRHHDMQPPSTITLDQVGSVYREPGIPGTIRRNVEPDCHAAASSRKAYRPAFPIHLVGVQVIAGRADAGLGYADLPSLGLQRSCGAKRLSRLHTRLVNQIAYKRRVRGFDLVVDQIMQLRRVHDTSGPSEPSSLIEGRGEHYCCIGQGHCLRRARAHLESNSTLHRDIIPYLRSLRHKGRRKAAFTTCINAGAPCRYVRWTLACEHRGSRRSRHGVLAGGGVRAAGWLLCW